MLVLKESKRSVRGKKCHRPADAVADVMKFSNDDVSLDEAVARNGGQFVWPKNGGILFDTSW